MRCLGYLIIQKLKVLLSLPWNSSFFCRSPNPPQSINRSIKQSIDRSINFIVYFLQNFKIYTSEIKAASEWGFSFHTGNWQQLPVMMQCELYQFNFWINISLSTWHENLFVFKYCSILLVNSYMIYFDGCCHQWRARIKQ